MDRIKWNKKLKEIKSTSSLFNKYLSLQKKGEEEEVSKKVV